MNEADAPSARRHSWSSRIPVEWGIALLALLVFLPAVTAGFVYDDTDLIVRKCTSDASTFKDNVSTAAAEMLRKEFLARSD